jgi:aerobic carbon-monoxide dehydrogenase medium subunit
VIPAAFDYHAPHTLREAIALLGQAGPNAKILAGGQSLIPAMRFRLAQPEILIDINGLSAELDYLEERNGRLCIGALTREATLERSRLITERYPLLQDTAKVVADPLVRARATVGGNLAHADPANDQPATMLAYGAEVVATGTKGARTIGIDQFFTGLFENALESGEILTEIRIPLARPEVSGAYVKLERKVGDYATAGVAVSLELKQGICANVRIGLTNVSSTPMRATAAEQTLLGKALTPTLIDAAGRAASLECDPSGDLRGSVEYKRDMVRVLLTRAVLRANNRLTSGNASKGSHS